MKSLVYSGSVLDGPDPEKLKPLVLQALPMLLKLMGDEQTVVRDTAAWTISKVCEICQDVVIQPEILQPLLPALSQGLAQEARVAANVCWVSLRHGFYADVWGCSMELLSVGHSKTCWEIEMPHHQISSSNYNWK